MEIVLTEIHKA